MGPYSVSVQFHMQFQCSTQAQRFVALGVVALVLTDPLLGAI